MEVWQSVLLALGGNAALVAVLGWLAKSFAERMLEKDFERFKSLMAQESQVAIERLKHDLERGAMEHEVRFSKLHEKRGVVIAETYALLVEAYWAVGSFVSMLEWAGEPSKPEKYGKAMNAVAEFFRYFEKHRIFLPEATCSQLEAFVSEMRKKAIGFGVFVGETDLAPETLKQRRAAWTVAWEYFEQQVPEARRVLEGELRAILAGKDHS